MKQEFPKKLSKELAAYLAGLMDGDGNISIAKQRYKEGAKQKTDHHRLVAVINMTHKDTIEWIRSIIPGSLYCIQTKHEYAGCWNKKPMHRWSIWGDRAAWFIGQIMHYMKDRRKQAEVGIKFQANIEKRQLKGNPGKFSCLSKAELEKRENYYWQMRELNSKKLQGG